ncbi:GNAT family N-acetyltransferase [Clavibacter michiganensis]|uniref:GNAT family N-acetyltransferase n=1 Tax=Clavibacter michiganensis TaxID=28447 RepID=A0A2S5VTG2_9MICO|nr:GNAT family N-acetyltransferase [Clavibacter michiganensis]PPF67547.1 GNAT family N-acetyltransferase [Clavibacter michiganensis]
MLIRPATDADWPRIFPFYRAVVDAGRTYALPAGQPLEEARPNWMAEAPGRTFVAVDADGTVLGSAKGAPNRPGRGAHVATGSFLVDPAHSGRGVGRALGEHVIAWARDEGYRAIQFNAVVETNRAAVHLWESLGFRIVGTVPEAFDDAEEGLVGLHVMHLTLR